MPTATLWTAGNAALRHNLSSATSATATTLGPGVAGSDIFATVHLGGTRVAWLLGDTYWATAAGQNRLTAVTQNGLMRNCIMLQTGLDMSTATWSDWQGDVHGGVPNVAGQALPFFQARQVEGVVYSKYPLGGIHLDDRVLFFGMYTRSKADYPNNLGTTMCGPWATMCYNTDAAPNTWVHQDIEWGWQRNGFHGIGNGGFEQYCPFTNIIDPGDGWLYAWCFGPARSSKRALCRFSRARAKEADLSEIYWYNGAGHWGLDMPLLSQDDNYPRTGMRRYRANRLGFGINGADQAGGFTQRADGKFQFTYIPSWQIEGNEENWEDDDPHVRYSTVNNITDVFTANADVLDIPLDTYDFPYGSYHLPEQTWSGKGASDQLIVFSVNHVSVSNAVLNQGNFGDARTYQGEVYKVTNMTALS